MVAYTIYFSKQAQQDAKKMQERQKEKAKKLIGLLKENPFQNPPPYEKLKFDLEGKYSRHIDIRNRLVYEVDIQAKTVKILRMRTHYE
ncbi:Txe/YoeB family addiction module toxin [Taurinivorans muris]|uniref:Putative mRNA interferase YoeB n=1 Tax=Taurinivorans muris TaxID=2787751 RepID=A0ABY5XZQ2_9BACT|nr:Txe/YoeB family addiction module toxin [Desulfovibrionaceae bacterium LT0009]